LDALGGDSEVILLADGVDEGEGTSSVRWSTESEDIDSENISREPEISRIGIRSTDGVSVDVVES
jgi:hypothetical protein